MAVKYYRETPLVYGKYVIGCEKMADVVDEIKHMHLKHFAETETLYLDTPPAIDYERLIMYEKLNNLVLITVRSESGTIVGNLVYFVGPAIHFKGMHMATEDAFFLDESVRKGRLAFQLLDYAEKLLSNMGIDMIGMSDKSPCGGKSLAKFMDRLGYKPVSISYMKELNNVLPESP